MIWSTVDTPFGPFTAIVDADGRCWPRAGRPPGPAAATDPSVAAPGRADRGRSRTGGRGGHPLPRRRAVRDRRGPGPAAIGRVPGARLGRAADGAGRCPGDLPEYAAKSGRPAAVRAAAAACARNAAALFVPCHRVLRTDGTLGGFRWGLEVKRCCAHEAASQLRTTRRRCDPMAGHASTIRSTVRLTIRRWPRLRRACPDPVGRPVHPGRRGHRQPVDAARRRHPWARCSAPARPGSWCPPGPGCTPPRPPGPPPTPRRWPGPTRPGCAPNGPACWSGSTSWPSSTTGRGSGCAAPSPRPRPRRPR